MLSALNVILTALVAIFCFYIRFMISHGEHSRSIVRKLGLLGVAERPAQVHEIIADRY